MLAIIKDWVRRLTGNKQVASGRLCGCQSIDDCPHTSEKDCKFDKAGCHLIAFSKEHRHNDHTNLRIWLFITVGILFYTFATIILGNEEFLFPYKKYVCNVISGISISVIAGAILSKVIDLPTRLKEYESSFINALASNSYLKSLDEQRLTRLRNDITEQLHKANAPCMAKGLITIDQRICDLLRQPYYTRYRQSVICTPKQGDSNYITKEHCIDYKLINPYGVNKDAIEYLSFSNLIMIDDADVQQQRGQEEAESVPTSTKLNAITDLKLSYQKDNEEDVVLKLDKDFKLECELLQQPKTEFYNMSIYMDGINKKPSDMKPGFRIDFKDHLVVHMEYKIDVHVKDACFTKRMRHPVKNFRLDYTCNGIEGKLYGQIFGTELKQSDFAIKYPTEHSISLEAFDWLLPDNGAFVVLNSEKDLHN